MNSTNGKAQVVELLKNIPEELRQPPFWLYYNDKPDPKKPNKKPRKLPQVKWGTPELRKANLRSLDYLLTERTENKFDGAQRWIEKSEGFIFVDLDDCRDKVTGDVKPWAQSIIDTLDTYTEISHSGAGFRLVCRGVLAEDFHVDPCDVEIYSGNSGGKLMGMTGNVIDEFHRYVEERQQPSEQLLARCKAGKAQSTEQSQPKQDSARLLDDYMKAKAAGMSPEALQKMEAEIMANDEPAKPTEEKRWRDVFHTVAELEQTPSKVFIRGILEEGVTFFGAHSGVGKTWLGLSISRALLSGEPLFGKFPVLQKTNVLYLVPEMGGSKFRERTEKLRINKDGGFFCQTIRDGACDLEDPLLLQAIAMTKATVILDTAIRFQAGDEQSSTQQAQGLGAKMFNLIRNGAAAVICMHHRSKDLQDKTPTLENTLRGTGDFGAMADCVWCVEYANKRGNSAFLDESKQLVRIALTCVKPRDMEPADPFVVQGRPHINESGDFRVICDDAENLPEEHASAGTDGDEKVTALIKANPDISRQEIRRQTGFGFDRIKRIQNEVKKDGLF
jgi:hypothetical protein